MVLYILEKIKSSKARSKKTPIYTNHFLQALVLESMATKL